jgi:nitrate/nitrite transport system substrate-binding protein
MDNRPKAIAPARHSRRAFLKKAGTVAGGVGILSAVPPWLRSAAWAAGSDAPEQKEVKIGFIPLTDCASVVIASEMGFDRKHGIKITPSKEASWASVRDKLVYGELDAAHVLYGLIYGVQLGISGPKKDMAVLMNINHNGQAISLSNRLRQKGATDGAALKKLIDEEKGEYTFAHTFPTGTHAMWLYYWLGANGVNPFTDVKTIVVPPPQMVANMRVGNMDGFCVGEPWGARAIIDKVGFTAITSQDIWKDHPEKVLGTRLEFVRQNPNTARAMIAAMLEASQYIDIMGNRRKVAAIIARPSYVNTDVSVIEGRMLGEYSDGLGKEWKDGHYMKFYEEGRVTFPCLSDGMWFMTQHRRWGLLKQDVDYLAIARQVNQIAIYKEAAAATKTPLYPELRSSTLMDGVVWDGRNPAQYAASFKVRNA